MTACKCDRCGKFFELPENRKRPSIWISVSTNDGFSGRKCNQYELCDECGADLGEWFNKVRKDIDPVF